MAISVSNISAGPHSTTPTGGIRKAVFVLCTILLTVLTVLTPYEITFDNRTLHLHATQPALAKDAGKGGGNGNAGGNKGNGNAKGQGGANGSLSNSGNVTGGTVGYSPAESGDSVRIGAPARKVQHANGMMEAIVNGRYVMKDARDRTIINRKATPADEVRLQSFAH